MANPRTIARIEARIQERAAIVLQQEISDPRSNFITVTRVEMKPDLLSGKIFYSVYGTDGEISKAKHMLEHAAGFIQRQIAPALNLRRMPHLKWVYDESVGQSSNLEILIQEARQRDSEIRGPEDSSETEPDSEPHA